MASNDRPDRPDRRDPAAPPPEPAAAEERRAEETFASRWSRRKQQARTEASVAAKPAPAEAPPPELPPLESLTPESDFSGFMHPKVDEGVRRTALKTLFRDPRYNVMDGLDVYIDDYSVFEPITPDVLAKLTHTVEHLLHRKKDDATDSARVVSGPATTGESAPLAEPPAAPAAAGAVVEERVAEPMGNDAGAAGEHGAEEGGGSGARRS